jgi:hypothetical protein
VFTIFTIGTLIYIGKSINIRKGLTSILQVLLIVLKIQVEVFAVSYEETGSGGSFKEK